MHSTAHTGNTEANLIANTAAPTIVSTQHLQQMDAERAAGNDSINAIRNQVQAISAAPTAQGRQCGHGCGRGRGRGQSHSGISTEEVRARLANLPHPRPPAGELVPFPELDAQDAISNNMPQSLPPSPLSQSTI